MTAKGHCIFSLAIAIWIKKLNFFISLSKGHWGHVIVGVILTCLLPDIDHPHSLLGSKLKWLSLSISKISKHRGITHSLIAIIIFILILNSNIFIESIIPLDFIYAMIIGYISHIIADILTPNGVLLFWPYQFRIKIPILNPNKNPHWEKIFCLLSITIACLYPLNLFLINSNLFYLILQKIYLYLDIL